MRKAYQKIKSLQSADGGFKFFEDSSDGVWLTAYIAQILGDARAVINIDNDVMLNIFNFLKKNRVEEFYKVDDFYPRLSQGAPAYRSIYYTAFTIIGFLKNKDHEDYSDFVFIIDDAKKYFEKNPLGNDYEKSVVAFALALADEDEHANLVIDSMNWNFLTIEKSKIKALQVEIASYVLLACLKLGREKNSTNAFNWLIKQRTPNGGFFSSHDTVLGLQALSAMSEQIDIQNSSINIKFSEKEEAQSEIFDNLEITKYVELPSTDRQFNISATGEGSAYVNIFSEYKIKTNTTESKITLNLKTIKTSSGIKLEIQVKGPTTNMAVIDVEIPSGFEYKQHSLNDEIKVKYICI